MKRGEIFEMYSMYSNSVKILPVGMRHETNYYNIVFSLDLNLESRIKKGKDKINRLKFIRLTKGTRDT